MTYAEFLERLRATPRQWELAGNGRDLLRYLDCCPLTACCEPTRSAIDYHEAIRDLGIDYDIARKIVDAADRRSSVGFYFDPAIRRDLLDACGLTEPA